MPRRRSIETRERDAQAVELRRRHLNYKQIAAQMGYSEAAAYQAVQRGLADMAREPSEEVRQIELERLDDIARGFQRVFATRHYAASVTGKVARHPETGEPLIDDGPVIQAGMALLKVMERRARYLGLDAPKQVEVHTIDAIDARLIELADQVAGVGPAERRAFLSRLAPVERERLLEILNAREPGPPWSEVARPEQLAPAGDWLVWIYAAGRGAGKTRAAAEWVQDKALASPGVRIALVGRTPADVRDVMIEGDSGILTIARDDRPVYQPTKRRLSWPNGSAAYTYSAEVPSQLRGPQHHYAWCDEASSWTDAPKGDTLDTAWNNLMLGLRLGQAPRCVVTTTPKPNALTRTILGRSSTAVTRGTTFDNLSNLAPSFREEVLAAYEGTRIGRQELLGELLEDVEGALWNVALLDENRVSEHPDLQRVVVGVDPSGGSGPDSDEQGIIVAGLGVDGELYVLADRSCKLSPNGWASRAVAAFHEFRADKVAAERNFGGEMVLSTIQQVSATVPVKMVHASRGKVQRAEPVAAAYEQHRVHHVGALAKLEDQMTTWTPADGTSPDRLDALVWAITELTGNFGAESWIAWAQRQVEALAAESAAQPEPAPETPEDARQRARHAAFLAASR